MYEIHHEITLPRPIDEVFPFFSDALNLERLTPPWLRFKVVTPRPIVMATGTLIDYRLSLRGLPLRWRSRITEWNPPHLFVDEQLRGPYRSWHHTHQFHDLGHETRIVDHVIYDHFGGRLVNRLLVAPDVRRIFKYRENVLRELFPPVGPASSGSSGRE